MNDKERLEEIKKHRDEAENSIDEYEFEKINFYNLHVDWLIEQAELAQELERQASRHKERIIQCALRKEQQKQTLSRNNRALEGEK